ncbi:beta-ketoacyl-[acyl-carrier-protein] synthase II [Collinsella sp. An7]|uniref:beta-ketoacyl-ACP synthase II n=1 Tax=Collinsella sp. An7 TaxID=1965651 RepID=UPI000B39F309|nr:beta-ketoacyl-ACP synthase II [Collinsella sp. An7]OUN46345.1 beta-ketoacyl-[acyl-carrier-protein] synthase II [Collinsella sp. An7]
METSTKRRVVITGMGAVTPLGNTVAQSWDAVRAGTCGIGPITRYDATGRKVTLAAEVKDWDAAELLGRQRAKHLARFAQFALIAAREAVEQAGLDTTAIDATRAGVIVSSGIGGVEETEKQTESCLKRGFDRCSPFYIPSGISNMAAGEVAIEMGFKGMCTCPVTACAGGSNAVGDAFRHIRDGYAEVMLAGGTEAAITPLSIGGFTTMRALHTGDDPAAASIPFDARRSGFVMGEGAGMLLLEELEHAKARGAQIIAEVVGYGVTCDAHHITAPAPNGEGGARAMQQALDDAGGVAPEAVDYINAHGTSTQLNDRCETQAIKAVFGNHAYELAVSSTKSMTGHMLGAAGAVEAIFTALAVRDGYLPATIGYVEPDPECDLDCVPNEGREASVTYALSNSLGFGGHNACLLMKKY